MEENKYISTKQALSLLKNKGFVYAPQTVNIWVKKNNLGIKFQGTWKINRIKFENFIKEL